MFNDSNESFFSIISNYLLPQTYDKDDHVKFMIDNEIVKISKRDEMRFIIQYCKSSVNQNINVSELLGDFCKLCFFGNYFSQPDLSDVFKLVYSAQKVVSCNFDDDDDHPDYICFYFQDKENNFRLIFPFFEHNIDEVDNITNDLMDMMRDYYESEEVENIISRNSDIYRPLYRSDEYELKYIFNRLANEEENADSLVSHDEIYRLFIPKHIDARDMSNEQKNNEALTYLPMLFTKYHDSDYVPVNNIEDDPDIKAMDIVIDELDDTDDSHNLDPDTDKFRIAQDLLPMIAKSRFKQRHTWLEIGRSLCSAARGKRKGLMLWMQKSEEADSEFTDYLKNYRNSTFSSNTVRTLAYYAKKDNPKTFEVWHDKWVNRLLEKAISCTDLDIAKLLFGMYWLEFTFDKNWYQFCCNGWIDLGKGKPYELCNKIAGIINRINKFQGTILNKLAMTRDDSEKKTYNDLILKCYKLSEKLKNNKGRSGIISLAEEIFLERGFELKLNKNPTVLATPNGMIELLDTKAVFRDTRPDDCVSIKTKVTYNKGFTYESRQVVRVLGFLRSLVEDEETLHFLLKYFASFLIGYNTDKYFVSFIGDKGNNGKSSVKRVIEETLGLDLCHTFPITFLVASGSRASSASACPELAGAENARITFAQEPKNNDRFNSSVVKQVTGNDSIYVRQLFKEGKVIKVMFKIICFANRAIQLEEYDDAMRNRCIFVNFAKTFIRGAPDDPEEQHRTMTYKIDPALDDDMPMMAEGLLWLMFNYYEVYKKEGLKPPESVRKYTETYWKENDALVNFLNQCVVKISSDDSNEGIKVKFLYNIFSVWYKEGYSNQVPQMDQFKNEVNIKLGSSRWNKWIGYGLSDSAIDLVAKFNIQD